MSDKKILTDTEKKSKLAFETAKKKAIEKVKKSKGLLSSIKEALGLTESFAEAELEDGTIIMYDGELAVGSTCSVVLEDGTEVPLAEGEHMLGGEMAGMKIVVDATGTVVELMDASETEVEEVEVEAKAEIETEKSNEEQSTAKLLKDFIAQQDKKFAELEKVNKANQKTILTMAAHIEKMGVEKKKFTRTESTPLDKVSKLA
jgi:hypothetical protein